MNKSDRLIKNEIIRNDAYFLAMLNFIIILAFVCMCVIKSLLNSLLPKILISSPFFINPK